MPTPASGARFHDEHDRDRGWASRVVKRAMTFGRLTVLDVTASDPALLVFLRGLDRTPLFVEEAGEVCQREFTHHERRQRVGLFPGSMQ